VQECRYSYPNDYKSDLRKGSIAYTIVPLKYVTDHATNTTRQLPSVVDHFNSTANGNLTRGDIINLIKKEIYLAGPVTMSFAVTEEFTYYSSGVFHPYPVEPVESMEKRHIYDHVVRVIGWGYDEGVKAGGFGDGTYWLAVNSCGEFCGDKGLFKIDTTLLEKHIDFEYGFSAALV